MTHEVASLITGAPVEAHTREDKLQEGGSEDDRIDPGHRPDLGPAGNMSEEEINARSELARYVSAAPWPATRAELLRAGLDAEAPDAIIAKLKVLPEGVRFENVQAVWEALGGHRDARHPS